MTFLLSIVLLARDAHSSSIRQSATHQLVTSLSPATIYIKNAPSTTTILPAICSSLYYLPKQGTLKNRACRFFRMRTTINVSPCEAITHFLRDKHMAVAPNNLTGFWYRLYKKLKHTMRHACYSTTVGAQLILFEDPHLILV